jgi:hypothetical protein
MSHSVNYLLWLNFVGNHHREPDYRVAKHVFLILRTLKVIPLISPNLLLIEYVAVTRNFDMSTQFCYIRRDFSFELMFFSLEVGFRGLISNFESTIYALEIKAIRA